MRPEQAGRVAAGLGKQAYSVEVLAQAAAVLYERAGWQLKAQIINYVVASGVLRDAD